MHFTVPASQQLPVLLRDFLRSQGVSLTQWRKAKTLHAIYVNQSLASPHTYVKAGDQISLLSSANTQIQPTELPLTIIWEDQHLLVIDKPAGMLIHPAKDNMTHSLANAVLFYYHSQDYHLGFHPVLRLDKNTSGLVLIAKYPHIQHLLSGKPKTITKKYLALVAGCPSQRDGTINAPIARSPNSIIERVVDPSGQPALTKYRVLANYETASLVEIELLTGRTHQIRVHFSYIGHPLLGDDLYGGQTKLIQRQALHAAELHFEHPVSKERLHFASPLPADLRNVMLLLSNNM